MEWGLWTPVYGRYKLYQNNKEAKSWPKTKSSMNLLSGQMKSLNEEIEFFYFYMY